MKLTENIRTPENIRDVQFGYAVAELHRLGELTTKQVSKMTGLPKRNIRKMAKSAQGANQSKSFAESVTTYRNIRPLAERVIDAADIPVMTESEKDEYLHGLERVALHARAIVEESRPLSKTRVWVDRAQLKDLVGLLEQVGLTCLHYQSPELDTFRGRESGETPRPHT